MAAGGRNVALEEHATGAVRSSGRRFGIAQPLLGCAFDLPGGIEPLAIARHAPVPGSSRENWLSNVPLSNPFRYTLFLAVPNATYLTFFLR